MPRLAIFDLDYTLTEKGTWGRFMATSMTNRPLCVLPLLLTAGLAQLRYKLGHIPRIRVKQAMMARTIVGWRKGRLTALANDFADAEAPKRLNPRVLAALQDHQAEGDVVLIASAAVDILVDPICARLGVDHRVSTTMAWTEDEKLAPYFASPNCYGEDKLARIHAWMADVEMTDFSEIIAYSDSRADAPMLEMADRAIIVCPKAKTRRYAEQNGFEIWD